ncbi:MAG: DUF4956 domain-containing protein [Sphingomonadales bacterium]
MEILEHSDLLNAPVLLRLLANIGVIAILILWIYRTKKKNNGPLLSFFAVNIIIFFVALVLNKVSLSTGAAFGLFAVFSMLRYRTEGLDARDMTYLFMSISLGLFAAMSAGLPDFGLAAVCLISTALLLDGNLLYKQYSSKEIIYDNILLIVPEKRQELIADLRVRTGLDITTIEIKQVDLMKDTALIVVFYA